MDSGTELGMKEPTVVPATDQKVALCHRWEAGCKVKNELGVRAGHTLRIGQWVSLVQQKRLYLCPCGAGHGAVPH